MHKSTIILKKKIHEKVPKFIFYRKIRSPFASKNWLKQHITSDGTIDILPQFNIVSIDNSGTELGPDFGDVLPPKAPLGIPYDYGVLHTRQRNDQQQQNQPIRMQSLESLGDSEFETTPEGSPFKFTPNIIHKKRDRSILRSINQNSLSINSVSAAEESLCKAEMNSLSNTDHNDQMTPLPVARKEDFILQTSSQQRTGITGKSEWNETSQGSTPLMRDNHETRGASVIPIGKQLNFGIERVQDNVHGAIPVSLQKDTRSQIDRAASTNLPKRLTDLFNNLISMNDDLKEMKEKSSSRNRDLLAVNDEHPKLQPKEEMRNLREKIGYGVLMDAYENDRFALENKLSIAGLKFERNFTNWSAVKILDNSAAQEMEEVNRNKSSLLIHGPSSGFKIPRIGHDPCSGCGATLQNTDEAEFGYVGKGKVEGYIEHHIRYAKARAEYGDRMTELQEHWDKNGKKVGEEYLDFMTQEEFNSIYRYVERPLCCDRCYAMQKGRYQVHSLKKHVSLTAPDFTHKLGALREKRCVVVLVCDITDFPGSMVYDLPGLISMNNPVVLVLNKLDCIQPRRPGYNKDRLLKNIAVSERYIREWARALIGGFNIPHHQIKDIIPISAKRGWNVMNLVETLEKMSNLNLTRSGPPLPVYFVGVSNVGKSSVINSIANKMYQATPPHPLAKKIYFTKTSDTGAETIHYRWEIPKNAHKSEMAVAKSFKGKNTSQILTVSSLPGTTVDTTAIKVSMYEGGTENFFDTPGLYPHWQHSTPLNLREIRQTLQRSYRNPPYYMLKEGFTLHFGGVGAIDIMKSSSVVLIAVYSSVSVQHASVKTEVSDQFFRSRIGTKIGPPWSLEPLGDEGSLSVKKSYLFECFGKHKSIPKADIYFCGVGWVSFYTKQPADIVIRVRTLPGIVHGIREPLRKNDLKVQKNWPRLPPSVRRSLFSGTKSKAINKIIRLTNNPVDLSEDPIKQIGRTVAPKMAVGDDEPFEDMIDDLKRSGLL